MRSGRTNWKLLVTAATTLLLLATLSYGQGARAPRHSITNITLNPPTPNVLLHNQRVTVSFSYRTTEPGGVRIGVAPFVRGSISMVSRMSWSKVFPSGRGTGSQNFTITSGNVTVDQIQITMWAAIQTESQFQFQSESQSLYAFAGFPLELTNQSPSPYLFEAYIPVRYKFRAR